jgi:hypothetical protein
VLACRPRVRKTQWRCGKRQLLSAGEHFSGIRTTNGRVAGRSTDHGADNVSDGLGVDPALLQNLARQPFNPIDRLDLWLARPKGGTSGCADE